MDKLSKIAPIVVILWICILAYGSQILFGFVDPHDLLPHEWYVFNYLVASLWICYARACFTDPGFVPPQWQSTAPGRETVGQGSTDAALLRSRWCRKCEAFKPPRTHHCRKCQRCIPKMDHHCPWTINCVSHRTVAHFLRFLVYAVVSMLYLESLLFERVAVVWDSRRLPSYLGPTLPQLISLFVLFAMNSFTVIAVGIMLLRSLWSVGANITTIESWEIERHETLLRRAKTLGGYLDGPDGSRVRIKKQEFPYDIGIYSNLAQALGSNPLTWLWPFATTFSNDSGLDFEVNGFEDPSTTWPPPDPDRMPRKMNRRDEGAELIFTDMDTEDAERLENFKARQREDLARLDSSHDLHRRQPFHERYSPDGVRVQSFDDPSRTSAKGEEAWKNSEGKALGDFGVDEDAEFYDEEDVPLAKLLQRTRTQNA